MWNKTLLLLIAVLTAANVRAEGIHYDRIPADATGYFQMDMDRFLSSRLGQAWGGWSSERAKQVDSSVPGQQWAKEDAPKAKLIAFLGEHADVTVYTPKSGGPGGWVLLWHTPDPKVRKRLEANMADSKTVLRITYSQQEIQYASLSAFDLLQMPNAAPSVPQPGETKKPEAPMDKSENQAWKHTSTFSIGLGPTDGAAGQMDNPAAPNPCKGPSYTAFVGQDLIVVAGDLPSMAGALDVMQGKRPSLAQQDPQGLKLDAPTGVMLVGAGLTANANYVKDYSSKPDNHTSSGTGSSGSTSGSSGATAGTGGGDFGFDMFGSFKAKARVARFDVGEDDKEVYIDASLTMKDAGSTEELKNLVMGVKALISLTHEEVKPLLDPLEVRTADKNVIVRWSWPAAKLPEIDRIVRAATSNVRAQREAAEDEWQKAKAQAEAAAAAARAKAHRHSLPATDPASLPAH